jgi:Spy/CpxP family protein refolding chaperone
MSKLRLALITAAASLFAFAAAAQSSSSPPAQSEQSGMSCSSRNKPAATS